MWSKDHFNSAALVRGRKSAHHQTHARQTDLHTDHPRHRRDRGHRPPARAASGARGAGARARARSGPSRRPGRRRRRARRGQLRRPGRAGRGAAPDGPTDNTRQHARTEAELRASGAATVFLRPVAFFQNLLWSAGAIAGQGALHQAIGGARIGLIDTRDVVDALERAALSDELDGQTFELTGPAAVTYDEVAGALARALGRPVRHVPIAPDALADFARQAGVDEWTAQLVRDYSIAYGRGWGDFTTDAVEKLTRHPARGVDAFAAEVFAPAAASAAR